MGGASTLRPPLRYCNTGGATALRLSLYCNRAPSSVVGRRRDMHVRAAGIPSRSPIYLYFISWGLLHACPSIMISNQVVIMCVDIVSILVPSTYQEQIVPAPGRGQDPEVQLGFHGRNG